MKKYVFVTNTGFGNHVTVNEKDTYVWYEFSNENDCQTFLVSQSKAEYKGVKVVSKSFQMEDLTWELRRTKSYQVIVRK